MSERFERENKDVMVSMTMAEGGPGRSLLRCGRSVHGILVIVGMVGPLLVGCAPADLDRESWTLDAPASVLTASQPIDAPPAVAQTGPRTASSPELGPLDTFLYAGSDPADLEYRAQRKSGKILQECMADHGWEYSPGATTRERIAQDIVAKNTGTSLFDAKIRHRDGYGLFKALLSGKAADESESPTNRYYHTLTPAQQESYAEQQRRCADTVTHVLFGDDDLWNEYWDRLAHAGHSPELDRRLKAGTKNWSRCMTKAGYSGDWGGASSGLESEARTLMERHVLPTDPAAVTFRAEEIDVADTEWSCYEQYVLDPFLAVRDAGESRFVAANQDLLVRVRASLAHGAE